MQSGRTFQAKNYAVAGLIAAAYDLTPRSISGGAAWVESDRYEIIAATPGDLRPTYDEQMAMLRQLLTERFHLGFHRQKKDFAIFEVTVGKDGPKLKMSTLEPDDPSNVTSTVFPAASGGIDHVLMPGRNASMAQFASVLQRAILDRPVVDRRAYPAATISTWNGHRMIRSSAANCLKVRLTNPEPDYLRPSSNNLD